MIAYLLVNDDGRGVTHFLGYVPGIGWRLACNPQGSGVCRSCVTDAPVLPLCGACALAELDPLTSTATERGSSEI